MNSISGVNLRTKKKRVAGAGGEDSQDGMVDGEQDGDRERPMSWEGELSDAEMSRLDEAINNSNELNKKKVIYEYFCNPRCFFCLIIIKGM